MANVIEASYQKFAKDILTIGITKILILAGGLVSLPLLTKTLGAHDYGIWSQVNVTIALVWVFVNLGLPPALVRFLAAKTKREEIQEEFYSVLSVVCLLALIVSGLLIAFSGFIAEIFFDGATEIVLITALIVIALSANTLFLTLFRTFRQMKTYSVFTLAQTYGDIGLMAFLVLNGYGLFSVVVAMLIVRCILFLILIFLIKSQIGIGRPHFSKIRGYLSFGLPMLPGLISSWVVTSSDRYVIAYFIGVTGVGTYAAGYGVGSIILAVPQVLGFVLPPTLSKLYDEGRIDEVKTHLSYSLKCLLALAIPFLFGATLLSKQTLAMLSTAEIASQGRFILPLIALGALFAGVYTVIGHIILLVKKTKIIAATWGAAASLNLGLNMLIVPHAGITGAAVTTLITYFLAMSIITRYSFRELRFDICWDFILKSLIASVIMSAAILSFNPEGTANTIFAIALGVIIYAAALFLLRAFKREEINFFRELFQRGD